ncbi:polysaccharide pyruvyl transferase family protein [Georgenia satyanarayanai]|uniref:polysaccharide pyruvyl transferase family protein n=1 Tax=Georgenia satyanarayanai TaxID=860221 RepID=UPI00204217D0|nr:polysaccharide pyruvyl transferase family protein [Georgenia satyanarayanai]MCM3661056.1 polysaccharide pyruvyl transferase family protein [Georgenia satyanarayanai]
MASLLYDSISPNTGDWAIGIAVAQELARHGVAPVEVLSPFEPVDARDELVVVGGGDLIRPVGDPFYDRFRVQGPAVLNAAGVWPDADRLDHLKEYRLVSARTSAEVDHLRSVVPDAQLLPDTTMTLESEHFAIEGLPTGEPVVGIHVVPHTLQLSPELVEAVDAIDRPKVFIPFTHYNYDDSFMDALPFDRSRAITLPRLTPLQLHSVIGQMSYVVVSSLHATLFAYAQHVPFVTVEQRKVRDFLADRGLTDWIFSDDHSLRDALARVEEEPPALSALVAEDRAAVREAFARIASFVSTEDGGRAGGSPVVPVPPSPAAADSPRPVIVLAAEQREEALRNRDHLIAANTRVSAALRAANADTHAELAATAEELAGAQHHIAGLENHVRGLQSEISQVRAALEQTLDRRLRRLARRGRSAARSIVGRSKATDR